MVSTDSAAEPIALVGISCRLPQAENPAAFWRLLHDGVDALTETADRWPATATERRRAGFLAEVAEFDAGFFGISPTEAAAIDPQQRLVLELAWEALEHAGIVPAALRDTPAGIFVGAIAHDYAKLADRLGAAAGPHSYTGTHRALIANRVSYFLRLTGPSLTVDTGQSSSLVAVQLACESLRRGESRLALAGGVNLNLLGETTETIDRFGALSPDGRCYTFDERANGYARGEGAALVVLKRLSDAIADGDRIRCVILGGAVNNDGGGAGLTAPSRQAQQQVIERACAQAGLRPADLDYVELHGTGTPVGDPIEAAALGAALAGGRGPDRPLLVGSVKTNIGHLEGAAGIAGLVKVALSLTRRELPASLNFHTAPAAIPLAELGLDVVRQTREWPGSDRPLVAGVSSFGMGGTNCHLVLAEYAEAAASPAIDQPVELPWLLSGRSSAALRAQADQLRQLSEQPGAVALALAGTRDRLEHRAVILGDDPAAGLAALATGAPHASLVTGAVLAGRTVLTFPGQGSQWPEMARELLASSPVFADRIEACAEALAPFVDFSLLDVLRGVPGAADFDRVDVLQPALWAVMVGLAELWASVGVRPDVVIGHSQGEIAAATAIGALSLSDGARVVALRSRAITGIAGSGGMMSVAAELAVVEAALRDHAPAAAVAAVNGPRSVVVSGTTAELAELQAHFTDAGYRAKIIPVDYASHSRGRRAAACRAARGAGPRRAEIGADHVPVHPHRRTDGHRRARRRVLVSEPAVSGAVLTGRPASTGDRLHALPGVQSASGARRRARGELRAGRDLGPGRRHAAPRPGRARPVPAGGRRGVRGRCPGGLAGRAGGTAQRGRRAAQLPVPAQPALVARGRPLTRGRGPTPAHAAAGRAHVPFRQSQKPRRSPHRRAGRAGSCASWCWPPRPPRSGTPTRRSWIRPGRSRTSGSTRPSRWNCAANCAR